MAVGAAADGGYDRLEQQVYYWHITAMTVHSPIPDFAAAREAMVENQLRPQGVTDPAILAAMARIEREKFVSGKTPGYSAAVLAAMGLDVSAIESDPALLAAAKELGINPVEAPLENGLATGAPYDQILIDGAIEYIPDALIDQLADGGRLGAGVIDRGICRLVVGRKVGGAFGTVSIGDAGVPPLPGFSRPTAFTF